MKNIEDILKKLEGDEYATCAVLGKLQEFIVDVSRSSNLSDIWAAWSPIPLAQETHCYEIKNCTCTTCPAFKTKEKCWLLDNTSCCNILIRFLMHRDKELLSIAIRDSLTKCYNRYCFDEYIEHLLMDANRHGDVITIMAIDIDKFKSVNDMYGHAVGDSVLIAVTDILMKAVRSNDMVFRIGGDEFLVVFPRTECCEIESIKGRLIALVGDWNVTSTLQEYRLNLSVGCVTWNPGENFRARLAEADAAMYEAKSKGGTTVEIPCN